MVTIRLYRRSDPGTPRSLNMLAGINSQDLRNNYHTEKT